LLNEVRVVNSQADFIPSATSTTGFAKVREEIRGLQRKLDDDCNTIADSSFAGSDATGTDYGYALKRFLFESESIISTSRPNSPYHDPTRTRTLEYRVEQNEDRISPIQATIDALSKLSPDSEREEASGAVSGSPLNPKGNEGSTIPGSSCFAEGCLIASMEANSYRSAGALNPAQVGSRLNMAHCTSPFPLHQRANYLSPECFHIWPEGAWLFMKPCSEDVATHVYGLWDFDIHEPGELAFRKGDVIRIIENKYENWSKGTLNGVTGIYPDNHVQPCRIDPEIAKILSRSFTGSSVLTEAESQKLFDAMSMCASSTRSLAKPLDG
jgi:SH3 domain